MSGSSDHDLAMTVRSFLENGTKFVLVIDNVWSVDAWYSIKDLLPNNGVGKVIITTHFMNVGLCASCTRQPHLMRLLTVTESWKLLRLEIFRASNACPYGGLTRIGESIASHCWGLPLGMVKIGGFLRNQLSTTRPLDVIVNEWTKVFVNNLNDHEEDNIFESSLPSDLRDCFLSVGVFPENYDISAWTLMRLWIAEGFITQPKLGQISLEETADKNLKHLIARNLVSVSRTNATGEVKRIRLHPAMRSFCISKASIKEHNLFEEIKVLADGVFHPTVSDIQNCRCLSIHSHIEDFLYAKPGASPRVRSLLCFPHMPFSRDPENTTIFDSFKLLRVLHAKSIRFCPFPQRVTQLIHLKYLALSINERYSLPESISELWNLQTLVVDEYLDSRVTIKANIWRMIQLRHLKATKATIVLEPEEGGGSGGENLQTLATVFSRARNLKALGVRGRLAAFQGGKSLKNLGCLEKLKLVNKPRYESLSDNSQPFISLPPNLKMVTLSGTHLDWKYMQTLGKIQTLEVLKLKEWACKGMSWKAVGNGFPRLEFLLIKYSDLVDWEASLYDFPRLRSLSISRCWKLRQIPITLATSLDMLCVEDVPRSAAASSLRIKQFKQQMQYGRATDFSLSISAIRD